MESKQPIIITTTSDDREVLKKIAQRLVANELAACCQISGPITSVYRWQGSVESASEHSVSIKTLASKFSAVESVIRELHRYDEPEIVATNITHGSESYLNWIRDNVD